MIEKGLSKEEMDFVTEALSIGAGNAATALSQMLGCGVDLPVPKVCFLSPEEVPSIIEDRSLPAIVAKIGFVGDMKGEIFYIVKEGDVRELVHLIKKTFPVDEKAGIAEISVMEETANIITGVYLSAISNFCGLNISHTIPVASSVTLQALTDEIKAKGYQLKGMQLIAIINEFTVAERRIVTYLLLALSEEALKILSLKIAEALRKLEIKELEEKVVQRTLEFHTVVETAGDAIISMKPPGEIYLWNKKAEEMFGYLADHTIGRTLHEIIVPERYRERSGEGLRKFFETGTGPLIGKTIEIEALRKDSTEFPIELSISAMNVRGEWHATGIIRDITERKRAEEAVRESEEKFRSVVDNIAIGVSLISPDMEILALNNQMRKWFPDIDVSRKSICYKAFNLPPSEDVCSYCPTSKTLMDGEVHEAITETPAGDKTMNYRILSSAIRDKEGKVIAAIEMVEDITERKRADDMLKQQLDELMRFEKATIQREFRMRDLKDENKRLKEKIEEVEAKK